MFYDYEPDIRYADLIHLDAFSQDITMKGSFDSYIQNGGFTREGFDTDVRSKTHYEQSSKGINLKIKSSITDDLKLTTGGQIIRDQSKGDNNSLNGARYFDQDRNQHYFERNLLNKRGQWEQGIDSIFGEFNYELTDNVSTSFGVRQSWVNSKIDNNNTTAYTYPHLNLGGGYVDYSSINKVLYGNNNDISDSALTFSTGILYEGIDNTILRASVSKGVIFPKLNQLYFQTDTSDGVKFGNPFLKKEEMINYEVGARYNGDAWYVDSSVFFSKSKDYITTFPCTNDNAILCNNVVHSGKYQHFANADTAKTYGLEAYIEYNGWDISPYMSFTLMKRSMEYGYISFDYNNAGGYDTGKQKTKTDELGIPLISGLVGLKKTTLFNDFTLDSKLFVRYASEAKYNTKISQKYNEVYSDGRPAWKTVNLAFDGIFGDEDNYRVGLELNNIFNEKYRDSQESIPAKGFHSVFMLGIKF
ncbi:TonB-dependent receptor [Xenorhabdus sp. PR6a]|uniref:TonB-dependent receptor domain-containing protein n=1 Tax=Xenorhabdus sp. PR6a TaxID=3025877 RepID=UPI002359E672|nr:TonB-dependent receptor [Xenorhabdus sp. PR6a]MDC9582572.1 TonB-dependent receptor [Xenorhabdus sp. PR6a]